MTVNSGVPVPADAKAVVVAASVVSDRYIQLTPAYTGGPQLADDAVIPVSRTAVPVEVDQIYTSLNRLAQALGPNGAEQERRAVRAGQDRRRQPGRQRGQPARHDHAVRRAVQDAGRQLGQPVRHDHQPAAVHLDAEGQQRAGAAGRAAARRRVRLPGQRPAGPRRRAARAVHRARPGAGLHRGQPGPDQDQRHQAGSDHQDPRRRAGVAGRGAGRRAAGRGQRGQRLRRHQPHAGRPRRPERAEHGAGRQQPDRDHAGRHGRGQRGPGRRGAAVPRRRCARSRRCHCRRWACTARPRPRRREAADAFRCPTQIRGLPAARGAPGSRRWPPG